jgi:acetyl-CoA carboxylase biotin carboxylase subunit
MAAIISAATITGADAIHPGIGFLSENAAFAQMVEEHGITFIGPSPEHLVMMGDKVQAKDAAKRFGIPVVPGSEGEINGEAEAKRVAGETGYPVLIKAAAGGGGKGMRVATSEADLMAAYTMARTEAKASFGNDAVYMEKYLSHPRHIEIQIIGDSHGNVVHLGERDCSLQRRHQKVLEEAPSPALNAEQRARIGKIAADAMRTMGYKSVGTIEFLFQDGEFYFIEMNTRLQIEHPVTEMITGIDLVREQIRVAAGAPLSFAQEDVVITGHAIECRINAEDPETFMPSPGRITDFHAAGGLGVRVDSALYSGYRVPPNYDSLIAKLVVHGRTRNECLMRLRRALEEMVIGGVKTNTPLHSRVIAAPDFINGAYDIRWLEKFVAGEI